MYPKGFGLLEARQLEARGKRIGRQDCPLIISFSLLTSNSEAFLHPEAESPQIKNSAT